MRLTSGLKLLTAGVALAGTAACGTDGTPLETYAPVNAVIDQADDASMDKIAAVISAATGRAQIEFGAIDLTTTSDIVVLPPSLGPHEGHSVAVPMLFQLMTDGASCYVQRSGMDELLVVEDIYCSPQEF